MDLLKDTEVGFPDQHRANGGKSEGMGAPSGLWSGYVMRGKNKRHSKQPEDRLVEGGLGVNIGLKKKGKVTGFF